MTKKQKSAAKLAAEASDKLDALIDAEEIELGKVRVKYSDRRNELYSQLDDATRVKLRALRAEVTELIEPPYEFDALGEDVTP